MRLVFSKLLSNCSVKLHPNKGTLNTKVAFREQVSWLCLLSEVTSNAVLGNGELTLNEILINSNQNEIDKINSVYCMKIQQQLRYVLIFTGSLQSRLGNLGCACALNFIFQKRTCGALIGAGALNRANTVLYILSKNKLSQVFNIKVIIFTAVK